MFLGIESLTEEGLAAFRKRSTTDVNAKALEVARRLGVTVAINIIADPDWDEAQFERVRQWAMEVRKELYGHVPVRLSRTGGDRTAAH